VVDRNLEPFTMLGSKEKMKIPKGKIGDAAKGEKDKKLLEQI
jgi:hypothetical protein